MKNEITQLVLENILKKYNTFKNVQEFIKFYFNIYQKEIDKKVNYYVVDTNLNQNQVIMLLTTFIDLNILKTIRKSNDLLIFKIQNWQYNINDILDKKLSIYPLFEVLTTIVQIHNGKENISEAVRYYAI